MCAYENVRSTVERVPNHPLLMLKFLYASAFAVAFTLPALAQSPLADSSGAYLGFSSGYSQSRGLIGPAIAAGYRQRNGLEYGIGFELDRTAASPSVSYTMAGYGASLGYTADVGLGAEVKAEALGYYRTVAYRSELGEGAYLDGSALGVDVSSSIRRPFRIAGSLHISPSLGVFANTSEGVGVESSGSLESLDFSGTNAGIQLGADLSFRLFGADVILPVQGRAHVFGERPIVGGVFEPSWRPSATLRVDF